ncbi:lecithin retinol acyltransferase family protein [Nannocystis punicea]|uniref:Lecithin retinol acyltransferase family protein n=1 Tax=Nannocystis punicea TaxID=2995304 RepID=A0ABY7HAT8_9BACT|nr:lecithin retinol acyltransferase family protein [Nannocystis poenicansa]WAS96371.1 lecithin retinol acyltransferase family protein [Nannocystis poenicansa]
MPVQSRDFAPGLILVRKIVGLPFGHHYGVWVAVDEVIHASKTKKVVVSDTFQGFAAGLDVHVSDYSSLFDVAPEAVVERARAEIGRWPYELADGNCETFVLWCLTEKRSSGLQMGTVKLLSDLADAFLLGPIKAARVRQDVLREFELRVSRLLLENFRENEEARQELATAIEKASAWSAEVLDDDKLEELILLHGECQTVLDRAHERRARRSAQQNEVLGQLRGDDDLEMMRHKLEMAKRLMVAQHDWLEYESDAMRTLLTVASFLKKRFTDYLFEQISNGASPEKTSWWSKRMFSPTSTSQCDPAA